MSPIYHFEYEILISQDTNDVYRVSLGIPEKQEWYGWSPDKGLGARYLETRHGFIASEAVTKAKPCFLLGLIEVKIHPFLESLTNLPIWQNFFVINKVSICFFVIRITIPHQFTGITTPPDT